MHLETRDERQTKQSGKNLDDADSGSAAFGSAQPKRAGADSQPLKTVRVGYLIYPGYQEGEIDIMGDLSYTEERAQDISYATEEQGGEQCGSPAITMS